VSRWSPIHVDHKRRRIEIRIDLVLASLLIAILIVEAWRRWL